ncbi:MAG: oligoendopeptidase F, partial [Pseudomonadota bacterium]
MHLPQPAPDSRTFDAREPQGGEPFGDLPEWDFSALYAGEDDPALHADLKAAEEKTQAFAAAYEGTLASADGATLGRALEEYEEIQLIEGRIMTFAGLRYYQNTTDQGRAKFYSDMQGRITDISSALVFFQLEMNRIDDEALAAALTADTTFSRYKPIVDRMRAMKPYQLSDELEKFLHDQSVVGTSAWNRLFDETMAGLTFDVEGESLNLEATLNLLTDAKRARREAGTRALIEVFRANLPLFARITNTLAKEKEVEDRWRKLPTPQAARHLSNHVEPEVVQALRDAVVAAYPRLSHRYYALKAKWLGLETLQVLDRNGPVPVLVFTVVGWDEDM